VTRRVNYPERLYPLSRPTTSDGRTRGSAVKACYLPDPLSCGVRESLLLITEAFFPYHLLVLSGSDIPL